MDDYNIIDRLDIIAGKLERIAIALELIAGKGY